MFSVMQSNGKKYSVAEIGFECKQSGQRCSRTEANAIDACSNASIHPCRNAFFDIPWGAFQNIYNFPPCLMHSMIWRPITYSFSWSLIILQEISKQYHDQKSLLINIDAYFATFPRMQRIPQVEWRNLRDGVFFLVKDITVHFTIAAMRASNVHYA